MSTQTIDPSALVGELIGRERWSRRELAEHRRRALQEIVRHAASASPYYREAFAGLDLENVDLEDLPVLTKSALMQEWDRVVTDPRLRLADVERRVAEGEPDWYLGEYRILTTGGSTGTRGVFVNGRRDFELTMAGMLRTVVDAGITPEMRLVSIGSPSPFHLSNQVFAVLRAGRQGSPPLDVTMPLAAIAAALDDYQPDVITTYPTILRLLADEQLDGRLDIAPSMAATGSEVLSDEVRERVREAWGIPVVDVYVSTEGGMMASELDEGFGCQVWEDMLILEAVDEQNRPVPPGVPSQKVLLTNLWCRAQPLIRYELADSITMSEEPNPTGRPFARIARIEGRSDDILRLPSRGGGEVAVHPFNLRAPLGAVPEVRQYQFRHRPDALDVRIVLDPTAPRDVIERIRGSLIDALEAAGAEPPRVEVQAVDAIARRGAGAKLTLVAAAETP